MSQEQNLEDDAQSGCSLDECTRVADLWFPDANLILRAENTLFRVHTGIICARSAVFSDMISVPQPAQPEDQTLDGHPIVYLHDSAAEVEVFLRAVFDSNYFMPPPSPTEFNSVIGIMRLAHKYDVPYLFRRALCHLESVFSPTLTDLIGALITRITPPSVEFTLGDVNVSLITISAVSEVGAVWILPAACYCACTFSVKDILSAGKPWNTLGADQQQICLTSRAELIRATTRTYRLFRRLPSPHCSSVDTCQIAVSAAHDRLENRADRNYDAHPLETWASNDISTKLCDTCHQLWTELSTEAQESLWAALPGILELPEWDELYKTRAAVLEAST
ncbi:hypothetical protein B0H17DRAFT_955167 [Mycena rosella]|uniref:BTB domain-containing protein n=1 Tax=Mycena rosella TaxID=1033263 RepID=A0AAD7CQU4_MYCRO|nr:hypothetical protein B0H17DRAFT_955167 [Mycena rosella]